MLCCAAASQDPERRYRTEMDVEWRGETGTAVNFGFGDRWYVGASVGVDKILGRFVGSMRICCAVLSAVPCLDASPEASNLELGNRAAGRSRHRVNFRLLAEAGRTVRRSAPSGVLYVALGDYRPRSARIRWGEFWQAGSLVVEVDVASLALVENRIAD